MYTQVNKIVGFKRIDQPKFEFLLDLLDSLVKSAFWACSVLNVSGIIFTEHIAAIRRTAPYSTNGNYAPPKLYKNEPITGEIATPAPHETIKRPMTSF